MKHVLLPLTFLPLLASAQYNVAYTVTVTKLKALADDCDGGAPFCLNAPQDPVFNMWTNDGQANENTNCWIFEEDPEIEYGLWKDIQNLEIANESGVNTSYISFDMSGFESDAIGSPGCTSGLSDDAVYDRQFVEQFDLLTIPAESTYVDTIDLEGVYFAIIEIYWEDLNAGLFDLNNGLLFKMGPNPSKGSFDIRLTEGTIQEFDLRITDIAGREVYKRSESGGLAHVDLSGQERGMYFVSLSAEGKTSTRSLILN
ncbi:MAG: hypothetical protein A3D92_15150 [Bacteroidetes bacterium RIFCSPHIGHO2_02_FULL_44_7]|nr:MAG: hypothetical protein A3D92_15150 [Bacteroidetes bacterium RIFCSPHIGHO2_02_FULL_44_7]